MINLSYPGRSIYTVIPFSLIPREEHIHRYTPLSYPRRSIYTVIHRSYPRGSIYTVIHPGIP